MLSVARFTATQFDAFPSSSDLEVKQKKKAAKALRRLRRRI